MKLFSTFFISLLLTSCTTPSVSLTPTDSPQPTSTQTATSTPTSTATILPASATSTPIPCDPIAVDFCITDGNFLFRPPIMLPGNDQVDITYLYGSTDNGKRDPHHGVEFQNAFGTPVYAAGDGEVVFADSDKETKFSPWTDFYGNVVIIRHANELYTLYAHLSNIFVKAGDKVIIGDMIGEVGDTGAATGSHLHFEVRTGGDGTDYFSTQNPELWLIPQEGTGTLSITLKLDTEQNIERPLVVSYHVDESADSSYIYYITSYGKEFDNNTEDAALGSLPSGRYRIVFNDNVGVHERWVDVEAGKLTQVYFVVQ